MRKETPRSETSAGPAGESSAVARSGISRRHLLVGAGALGVAAAALPLLHAKLAMASSPIPKFLGSNRDVFRLIQNGLDADGHPIANALPVPGLNGVRIYDTKPTGNETVVPSKTWPAGPPDIVTDPHGVTITVPYSGPIVYSIYPAPANVVGPTPLGTQPVDIPILQSLIASAPPNSYLTAWHEGLSLPHPDYITADSLLELHSVLNTLCQGTNVTYGTIFGTKDTWDSVPDNLGFYGLDPYATNGIQDGMMQLDNWINAAKGYYGSISKATSLWPGTVAHYPNLLIGETNMPPDPTTGSTALRGEWFEQVCTRMKTYGTNAIGVLTFWNPTGKSGGPWLPQDTQTEQDMNDIIQNIF